MPNPAEDIIEIDLDVLKVREIEALEDLLGEPFDTAFAQGKPKGKALRAVACMIKRRTDPDFTMEQAGDLTIRLQSKPSDPTTASS